MVPLIGYVDRFSARPGERIAVKVSSQSDQPYQTDLVRIIRADANPAGPGIKLEEIAADFAGAYVSRFPAGAPGIVRRGRTRRAGHVTRSLHYRRSGTALATRRTAANRLGD